MWFLVALLCVAEQVVALVVSSKGGQYHEAPSQHGGTADSGSQHELTQEAKKGWPR